MLLPQQWRGVPAKGIWRGVRNDKPPPKRAHEATREPSQQLKTSDTSLVPQGSRQPMQARLSSSILSREVQAQRPVGCAGEMADPGRASRWVLETACSIISFLSPLSGSPSCQPPSEWDEGGWVGSGVRQSPRWQINQLSLCLMSEIHHSPAAAEPREASMKSQPSSACSVPTQPATDCHQDT